LIFEIERRTLNARNESDDEDDEPQLKVSKVLKLTSKYISFYN